MHKRAVAAERQVPIPVGAERDEFDRGEIIGRARGAAEPFIALIVAKPLERRRTWRRCRIRGLSLQNPADRQTRRQQLQHMNFAAAPFASARRQSTRSLAAS